VGDVEGSNTYYTASGTITVVFTIGTATFTETALYRAKYGGAELSCSSSGTGDTDCITWNNTGTDATSTSTGIIVQGNGFEIGLNNASDWDISPGIYWGTPGPTAGAGLPGVFLAIGMIALVGWRRRRKAQAQAAAIDVA
jgi:MYXO-CTERM domain-containing protein